MYRIQGPRAYVQGPGALKRLGELVGPLGRRFLVATGRTGMSRYRPAVEESLRAAGVECAFELLAGNCTAEAGDRLAARARELGCDGAIGLGGGRVIDAGKLTAARIGGAMVVVPTLASSDAPCSSLAILYDDAGAVCDVSLLGRNPDLVVMDSELVARAPARMLACGMGDALATYYEARVCYENGFPNAIGTSVSQTGIGLARICRDILYADGLDALDAVERQTVTPALERVIEANTYLSAAGFECGGLSCAHALQDALATIEDCHGCYHGEKVAFGTLCLLAAEGRPRAEQMQAMDFCVQAGLPVTLAQLGLTEGVEEKLRAVQPLFCPPGDTAHFPPPGVDGEALYSAIREVDLRGRAALEEKR